MKSIAWKCLFGLLGVALLLSYWVTTAAQTSGQAVKARVMILGVYHFHNPNQDFVKTDFDDHLSAKRQQQIAEVIELLAQFKPTKIALEATPEATNILNDYAAYLKGEYKLTANEREQLGFRLAQRFGHKQVYLVDHHIGMDINGLLKAAQQTDNRAFLAGFQQITGLAQEMLKQQVNKTVRESLFEWNEPQLLAKARDHYLQMARVRSGEKFIGADVLTSWYQRNFRIFTNLVQVVEAPQERVLVIFGNAHAPILRELVQSSPDLQLVEPNDYLKQSNPARPPQEEGQALIRRVQEFQRLRALGQELMTQKGLPGFSIAVAVGGETVWAEGFGFADLENRVPVTPQSRFRIGSLSKLFTAAVAARLYEKGKLDLDAPVQRYLLAFPRKEADITARQLLGHLSGIRHYTRDEFINRQRYDSVTESLKLFQDAPLLHAPGAKYSYSSYGYTLLSAMLEAAAGKDFLACVQEEVAQPLQMQATTADDNTHIIPQRVRFYARTEDGQWANEVYTDNSVRWAAGGFLSTAADLARFGLAHLQDGFLKAETRSLLFTSQKTSDGKETGVGLAWRIGSDSKGRRTWHHGGESLGGRAFLLIYPEQKIVIALLANLTFARFAEPEASKFAELFMP